MQDDTLIIYPSNPLLNQDSTNKKPPDSTQGASDGLIFKSGSAIKRLRLLSFLLQQPVFRLRQEQLLLLLLRQQLQLQAPQQVFLLPPKI